MLGADLLYERLLHIPSNVIDETWVSIFPQHPPRDSAIPAIFFKDVLYALITFYVPNNCATMRILTFVVYFDMTDVTFCNNGCHRLNPESYCLRRKLTYINMEARG